MIQEKYQILVIFMLNALSHLKITIRISIYFEVSFKFILLKYSPFISCTLTAGVSKPEPEGWPAPICKYNFTGTWPHPLAHVSSVAALRPTVAESSGCNREVCPTGPTYLQPLQALYRPFSKEKAVPYHLLSAWVSHTLQYVRKSATALPCWEELTSKEPETRAL